MNRGSDYSGRSNRNQSQEFRFIERMGQIVRQWQSRIFQGKKAFHWNFLRQTIPSFPLPLNLGYPEPIIDLQTLLNGVDERARYHLAIDYNKEPVQPLKAEDVS